MPRLPITLPLEGISFESAVSALANRPGFVAIDSRNAGPSSRFSIVASEPAHTLSFSGAFVTIDGHTVIDSPLSALAGFLDRISSWKSDPYLPFSGGVIGYIGFEGSRALGGFAPAKGFSRFPQCRMGLYETAAIFDHAENQAFIVSNTAKPDKADCLVEKLSDSLRIETEKGSVGANEDFPRRMVPDDSNFERILKEASLWLKSEKLESVHLARRKILPLSDTSPISTFLVGCPEGQVQAVFSHEGAYALARAQGARPQIHDKSSYPSGISRARRLAALAASQAICGTPMEKAVSFLDEHEDIHRNLYGGFFGTLDSRQFTFRVIDETREFSDGAMTLTCGANLDAGTDTRGFLNDQMFGAV